MVVPGADVGGATVGSGVGFELDVSLVAPGAVMPVTSLPGLVVGLAGLVSVGAVVSGEPVTVTVGFPLG